MNGTTGIAFFIGNTASSKKARDIKILNVRGLSEIADYFVLCSGGSSVQVKAIADEIEEKMSEKGYEINHKEGYNAGRWILLDYGEVIAHIFCEEEREFYDLERLWVEAEAVSI